MCNVGVPPRTNMIGTSDCREISFSRTQSLQIPKYSHGPRELDTSQRIPNCVTTMCNVGVPPRTNMIGTSDCREISFSRTQSLQIPKYSHGPRELDTSQRIPNGV